MFYFTYSSWFAINNIYSYSIYSCYIPMFDPKIPNNSLPLLPGDFDYEQVDILKATIAANNAISKLNWLARLLPNVDLLMAPLLVKESVESNKIENINTTTVKVLQSEAVYAGKIATGPEKEVLHYREALFLGQEKMWLYGGLPSNLLIEIQQILEPKKQWIRSISGTAITKNNEIIYTPPEWESNIRDFLSNLEVFIHDADDIDPLIKVAVLHFQFESIHPFYDGNGRTGRILMLLYLLLTKKLEYPILFLSEYINKTRTDYYTLLNKTNQTNDYTDFVLYILKWIEEQSLITQEKIEKICQLMDTIQSTIQGHSSLDYHKITQLLFSYPFMSVSKFQDKMAVTKPTVSKYISILEKQNIIQKVKIGRKVLIFIPQFIDLLS